MHLAVLLLVLLPFAQCEPEPLNLELDLVANVDHQCEQSIPPPTERNTAPHADSNIEIELIILDLLGIEAELGASEPDTAEPDPGPDCTPITSVAPPCPPLPDKCMAERAVLLDHPDDAQEPRPTTAPEIAVQPQAGIDTEKNPDKSSKGEDDKPVRSPPEECTLVTDDLDLHSPDLDVSQRDGVTGDYLPTAKRHAHQAHNKTHGTRVPDNHSPGPHAQSISGGCKSDEMRCARGGTCLANTVKCCKGGKTYCPRFFYCINNGKSCCRVGKWCPLYSWRANKRNEHSEDANLIEAVDEQKLSWGFSVAMDFRLG